MSAMKPRPWAQILTPEVVEKLRAGTDRRGPDECWVWRGAKVPPGYGSLRVPFGNVRAHRATFALVHGEAATNAAPEIIHSCDNPPCVNPAHLRAGTAADNARDREERGRRRKLVGADHPRAKLTPEAVRKIRQALSRGETQPAIARDFGVTRGAVCEIALGRNWRHVAEVVESPGAAYAPA